MKIIDNQELDRLSLVARSSPRMRKNLNLHDDFSDPCQRLFNAMEPGTYIRPHRHSNPEKHECFMAIRGRFALIEFDDQGKICAFIPFGQDSDVVAIDLPPGVWHTIVCLEPGSIFFETKAGPYVPISDKDFAAWAPEEGDPAAENYLISLLKNQGQSE